MTNKEKLDYIYENIPIKEYHDKLKQCFEDLEKDLEILEILKKHFHIESDYYDSADTCSLFEYVGVDDLGGIDLTEEEHNKVKEWLEND